MTVAMRVRRIKEGDACIEGGSKHAWEFTGLDTINDRLVNTRTCVWCRQEQTVPYGHRKGTWANRVMDR